VKPKELRDRTKDELQTMEQELIRDLWKTRMNNFTNQLDDTAKVRRLRREISRVKTVITEMTRQSANQGESKGASEGTA
jgi:large subunit ribosomal protein L29